MDLKDTSSLSPLLACPQLLSLRSLYEETDTHFHRRSVGRTRNPCLVGLQSPETGHLMTISKRLCNLPLSSFVHVWNRAVSHSSTKPRQVFLMSTDCIGSCLRRRLKAFAAVRRRLQARLRGLQHLSHRRPAASPAGPPAAAFSRHNRLYTMRSAA